MRFYIKLFFLMSLAVVLYGASGYCENLSHIRDLVTRPTSDRHATEEMHAAEGQLGWDVLVATPSTQPSTQPSLLFADF